MIVSLICRPLYDLSYQYLLHFIALFIGFTQRSQTVSEGSSGAVDIFSIGIDRAVSRTTEREYRMMFILEQNSTAIVEPSTTISRADFDAAFGTGSPRMELRDLKEGQNATRLTSSIKNDLIPEEEECFTIRIFPIDSQGSFLCNDDDDADAVSFFCNHTICIQDDDGKCQHNIGSNYLPKLWALGLDFVCCRAICRGICGDDLHC